MISSSCEAGFDFVDVDAVFEIVLDAGFCVRLFRLSTTGLIVVLVRYFALEGHIAEVRWQVVMR